MKRAVTVAITGLVGLGLGVAWGLNLAKSSTCEGETKGETCYRYFGHYFTDWEFYGVTVGLLGLAIGLAVGLLIVATGWPSRRS